MDGKSKDEQGWWEGANDSDKKKEKKRKTRRRKVGANRNTAFEAYLRRVGIKRGCG